MMKTILSSGFLIGIALIFLSFATAHPGEEKRMLQSGKLRLSWSKSSDGWKLSEIYVHHREKWTGMKFPSAMYTVLYSAQKVDNTPVEILDGNGNVVSFQEEQFKALYKKLEGNMTTVNMNTAGKAYYFYPDQLSTGKNGNFTFRTITPLFTLNSDWQIDEKHQSDILVSIEMTAKADGYYSIASPSLATVKEKEIEWALVPGYFQGKSINRNFLQAYAYGQGIPEKPVVLRDRTATTLSPIISLKNGISMSIVPEPGTSRNPWQYDKNTHNDWDLGLSIMNRRGELSPTLYHPVLGEAKSYLKKGQKIMFKFRYSIQNSDWYTLYKNAIDLYQFDEFLKLKKTKESLTDRILKMRDYVTDDRTSKWRLELYEQLKIGAQSYLGGVYKSDNSMKNSDYGAMWMLAKIGEDSVLKHTRLPYALNFKIKQQQQNGFFKGAPKGQYYLSKSKTFTEEWGNYVEPIALTYYIMLDAGNVLLFEPDNQALKTELRLGADRLLAWMKPAGNWPVAFDHVGKNEMFRDVEDLRPTFYGLVVAHRMLKDEKYLIAACKAADWYIKNAVEQGKFLGVCGDTRFAPDFATGQSAQALLDLYEITRQKKYLNAAIEVAKIYTTSIYTHPIPSGREILVNGIKKQDWEISQVGLSFEHGGTMGSANQLGPILLASHAGMFVRMFRLTKDSLFLNMARAAAWGRDAFVNPQTGVASYYWKALDQGAGPFPHHAWWQIGWLTDYLLSEIELRSAGNVSFPRGFITPKVGPHQTYGFLPGTVYGVKASLLLKKGLLKIESPYIDYFTAAASNKKEIFLFLLNNSGATVERTLSIDPTLISDKGISRLTSAALITTERRSIINLSNNQLKVKVPAYGLNVISVSYQQ